MSDDDLGKKLDGIREDLRLGIDGLTATLAENSKALETILASQENRLQRPENKVFPPPIADRLRARKRGLRRAQSAGRR